MWIKILSWAGGKKLNTDRLLLQSLVMEIKTRELLPGNDDHASGRYPLWTMVHQAFCLALYAEDVGNASISALLHEMDRTIALNFVRTTKHPSSPDYMWPSHFIADGSARQSRTPTHDNFLSLMIKSGLYHSVADVLSKHPQALLSKEGRPLLDYVFHPDAISFHKTTPRMIKLLFEYGADPNQSFDDSSAWQNVLRFCARFKDIYPIVDPFAFFDALTIFVKRGANPNACIDLNGQRYSALQVLKVSFGNFSQGRLDLPAYQFVREYTKSHGVWIPDKDDDYYFESLMRFMLPEHKKDLRLVRGIILDLIKLLKSKGAKAQTWRKDSRGKWVKVGGLKDRYLGFFARRDKDDGQRAYTEEADPGNFWQLM